MYRLVSFWVVFALMTIGTSASVTASTTARAVTARGADAQRSTRMPPSAAAAVVTRFRRAGARIRRFEVREP
jgi:hypothetical protein